MSELCPDRFHELATSMDTCTERLGGQYAIWALFGVQGGPATEDDWRQARNDPFPRDRSDAWLLDWKQSINKGRLTLAQRVYLQQLARMCAVAGLSFTKSQINDASAYEHVNFLSSVMKRLMDDNYPGTLVEGHGWFRFFQQLKQRAFSNETTRQDEAPEVTLSQRQFCPDLSWPKCYEGRRN